MEDKFLVVVEGDFIGDDTVVYPYPDEQQARDRCNDLIRAGRKEVLLCSLLAVYVPEVP